MVKTRSSGHAAVVKGRLLEVLKIFGRTLTIKRVTRIKDEFGQIKEIRRENTDFKGDLQFGLDLDQRYIEVGILEVGEGVLYIHPDELNPLPKTQDLIVDGNSEWELVKQVESPELGGDVVFYSYRCRRRPNKDDV